MPGSAKTIILAGFGCVAVLALAACGGGVPEDAKMSQEEADRLLVTLEQTQAAVESDPPDCETAAAEAATFEDQATNNLEEDVEARDALIEGAENLQELIDQECTAEEPDTTTTSEPTDDTTTEETEPEETEPEETEPDEDETTDTGPPEDNGPPEDTGPPGNGGPPTTPPGQDGSGGDNGSGGVAP